MSEKLVYKSLNSSNFVVRGDKDKYDDIMKSIGARWNKGLREGPGWILLKEKENELKKILEEENEEENNKLKKLKENAKSRKEQKKFHRAISETKINKNKKAENKSENNSENTKKTTELESTLKYFKKFKDDKKEPKKESTHVKKSYYSSRDNSESNNYDSTSEDTEDDTDDDSCSSGFPSSSDEEGNSPPERQNIYKKIDELQRRITELECKKKK